MMNNTLNYAAVLKKNKGVLQIFNPMGLFGLKKFNVLFF